MEIIITLTESEVNKLKDYLNASLKCKEVNKSDIIRYVNCIVNDSIKEIILVPKEVNYPTLF